MGLFYPVFAVRPPILDSLDPVRFGQAEVEVGWPPPRTPYGERIIVDMLWVLTGITYES
jgi:hypothetical protein